MNEELRIIISAEIAELRQSVQEAQEQIKGLEKKGKSSLDGLSKAAGTAGKAIAKGVKAAAVGVAALTGAMLALAEGTREYREDQNKLNAAFTSAGMSAAAASETYAEMYRNLGETDQAAEAAQQIALLADSEQEAAKWAEYAAGVVATFGDALPVETFYEGANETLKLGEATGAFTQMLEGAGLSVEDFNAELLACNSETEKQALMLKYTEMAVGDAGRAYKEMNADIYASRDAQMALTNSLAELGGAVEPIVTILKQGLATALQDLAPGITQVSEGLRDLFNGVDGGAEKLSEGIQSVIDSLLNTITNMLPTVLNIGVEIIMALLNGLVTAFPTVVNTIIELIPQIIDALVTIIPQITGAILGALPQILEAILQTMAAITEGIAEMLPTIVKQIVEVIPLLIKALLNNIPVLLEAGITLLMAIVDAIPEIIPPLVDAIPDIIETLIDTLLDNIPILLQGAIQLFMAIVQAIPKIIPALVEALPKIVVAVIDGLVNNLDDLFKGIWDGIVSIFKNLPKFFGDIFKGAFNLIKSAFSGITNFFSGIWNGIKNIFKKVGDVIAKIIVEPFKSAINTVLKVAVKIINGFISAINLAIGIINLIPGVKIKKLSKLEVPKMAKGGIVDGATLAIVGEQGKEAVMPLENNTEWMDILAKRIAGVLNEGGSRQIVLQVDGKTFAQTAVKSINNLTRQQGKLTLNLV